MRYRFAMLCVLMLPGTPADGEGALRCVRRLGERCWAVGDGGTVLLSDDSGETWRTVETGSRANFESVSSDGSSVFLFGGSGVPGHPQGFGTGAIYRTDDGGETFHPVAGPAGGWLYGGRFAGPAGGVFGQASPRAPGGIWRTATAGRLWKPVPTEGTGPLRAGAFRSIQYAYLVGARQRIVALRGLTEPRLHPSQRAGATGLLAAALADAETCWAVGENGIILRSRPSPSPWMPVAPALPVGTRRLADFEAVAFASPREGWIGGGLLGVVLHTTNAGATWTPLPAPGPGPIHALVHLGGGSLLAAGDAGRIWRSTDAGKSWKLTHGPERTDVLFVIAPGDLTVYPAIVAHARAGCNVAVLYAATAPTRDGVPADQPLRAAAIAAGARGVTVLSDFRSLTLAGENETLSSDQILSAWSKILDVPSRPELLRQIAAAIRLYRPRVLAVGPGPEVGRGRLAENHLIARLGQRAAELAKSDEHLPELEKVGLPPYPVKRVFVGIASNEDWLAPWERQSPVDLSEARVRIDATVFPRGETTSLEMLAQRAVWRIPGFGLLDRPHRHTGYACAGERRRLELFTTGLTKARARSRTPSKEAMNLASAIPLRVVAITGSAATALPGLVSAARDARDDPLGPDRLLLAWARLLDEGRFVHAEQARDAFLKHGGAHPLFARMNVFALAAGVSGEWNAQLRTHDARRPKHPPRLSAAVNTFATKPLWNETPPGMMLHAKALIAASRVPEGKEVLERLARRSYTNGWSEAGWIELEALEPRKAGPDRKRRTVARWINTPGRIDGRMDEEFWGSAPSIALRPGGGNSSEGLTGDLRMIRTATHVVGALRLPAARGRVWTLDIAVDADRDAWTQAILHAETTGRRWVKLTCLIGPPARLDPRRFLVEGQRSGDQWTFEFAVPLLDVGTDRGSGGVWRFQVRATANKYGRISTLYYQPQPDRRLLPERYGLLQVAPAGR